MSGRAPSDLGPRVGAPVGLGVSFADRFELAGCDPFEAGLLSIERLADPSAANEPVLVLGHAHQIVGDPRRLEALLRAARSRCESDGDRAGQCFADIALGDLLGRAPLATGAAESLLDEAISVATALGHRRLEGSARLCLARVRLTQGASHEARVLVERAAGLLSPPARSSAALLIEAVRARALMARGDLELARARLERALAEAEAGPLEDAAESALRLTHVWVQLVLAEVPEALAALVRARERLVARAAAARSDVIRGHWLHDVPDNLELLSLASELKA